MIHSLKNYIFGGNLVSSCSLSRRLIYSTPSISFKLSLVVLYLAFSVGLSVMSQAGMNNTTFPNTTYMACQLSLKPLVISNKIKPHTTLEFSQ